MAEQSSSTVMLRALVMLACLVAIPLAAIFGTSMPEIARKLLAGKGASQRSSDVDPDRQDPQFEPMPRAEMASALPVPMNSPAAGGGWQAGPTVLGSDRPDRSAVISAGYEAVEPVFRPPGSTNWRQNASLPPVTHGGSASPALLPSPAAAPSAFDQFTQIQQRLRQLGTTYYLLETWGSDGQSYRFYCRVPIRGDRTNSRYFEVIDTDQLRAMSRVLRQVETWRAGGG